MKILITNYTFDASAKTITFPDYVNVLLESFLLITNVTDNVIIYNFASATKGGSVATNVLTLDFDTTAMDDTDDLQIFYDDTFAKQSISASSLPLPTGASTESTLASILSESDFDSKIGSLTETAPASDTASSGLNGRLQRISQRITSLIASILTVKTDQTTHGTTDLVAADILAFGGSVVARNTGTASAGTLRVVLANDQPVVSVSQLLAITMGWTHWSTPKDNSNTPLTNTVVTVRGSQLALGGYIVYNPNAGAAFVQCFDSSTGGTVTLGTTRPDTVICIPGGSAANIEFSQAIQFAGGLKIAATTTDSGSTAPSSGLTVSLMIK